MPTPTSTLRKQVGRGLAFLRSLQTPDGSFTGIDLFAHATVLQLLNTIADSSALPIKQQLAAYLLSHKQADGSYEADLHTTCAILHGLHGHSHVAVSSDMIGALARKLIANEYHVGGPYRGLPDESQPDIGTNTLIADLLAQLDAPLPGTNEYVQQAQQAGHRSAFYTTKQYPWEPVPPTDTADSLCKQRTDGSWPARPYCRASDGSWLVSDIVSTTQTIARLSRLLRPAPIKRTPAEKANINYDYIVRVIEREIYTLKEPLRETGIRMLNKILTADSTHEIALLPFNIADDMHPSKPIGRQRLTHLGVGNIYNWMAYTIYDDFLDGSGNPWLLSIANVSLRAAVRHFQAGAPDMPIFLRFINQTFDGIDTANAWEVTYCHVPFTARSIDINELPTYGNNAKLAERSYSHALPALGVLANCGISPHDPDALHLRTAFKHYLIARQLSDDLRDWQEDLRAGQISPVVGAIIASLSVGKGSHHFDTLVPAMQRQFWQRTLQDQCRDVSKHLRLARRALRQCSLLRANNSIDVILDELEGVVARTHAEQHNMQAFLQGYRTT